MERLWDELTRNIPIDRAEVVERIHPDSFGRKIAGSIVSKVDQFSHLRLDSNNIGTIISEAVYGLSTIGPALAPMRFQFMKGSEGWEWYIVSQRGMNSCLRYGGQHVSDLADRMVDEAISLGLWPCFTDVMYELIAPRLSPKERLRAAHHRSLHRDQQVMTNSLREDFVAIPLTADGRRADGLIESSEGYIADSSILGRVVSRNHNSAFTLEYKPSGSGLWDWQHQGKIQRPGEDYQSGISNKLLNRAVEVGLWSATRLIRTMDPHCPK